MPRCRSQRGRALTVATLQQVINVAGVALHRRRTARLGSSGKRGTRNTGIDADVEDMPVAAFLQNLPNQHACRLPACHIRPSHQRACAGVEEACTTHHSLPGGSRAGVLGTSTHKSVRVKQSNLYCERGAVRSAKLRGRDLGLLLPCDVARRNPLLFSVHSPSASARFAPNHVNGRSNFQWAGLKQNEKKQRRTCPGEFHPRSCPPAQ